jgi:hypothetical protein
VKARFFFYLYLLLTLSLDNQLVAQSSSRQKLFQPSDTIKIDTVSIIPGSLNILYKNQKIDSSFYKINYYKSLLIFKDLKTLPFNEIEINYRVFPIDLSKVYFHKAKTTTIDSLPFQNPELIYHYRPAENTNILGLDEFEKSGNISRGVTVGNGQNLSVASDMNLQLAGMISPELKLTAAITDNNIPIQPDGNTQQLQDFDQVFMRLDHQKFSVTAGDFVLNQKDLKFMQYTKKSQGALININLNDTTKKQNLKIHAGAAIAKGNYNRYKFNGVEGNQGPYKLQGANFERYIIVLSGTERVYMDGKLLERGETSDYIIDYNTAEIIFMSRVIITKDKRFEVEFEYSEQNYSRALIAGGMQFQNAKLMARFDMISETDLKSQPIQSLSEQEKLKLSSIGDSLSDALVPSIDSVGFFDDRILYLMKDSLGFDSVFVFSTNPQLSVYQLTFSLVGIGRGDYISVNTAANGKVYQWISPENGKSKGDYAPVRILITPKKRQIFSVALNYNLSKHTKINSEFALSINDLNSYSALDKEDDNGLATHISINDERFLSKKADSWKLGTLISYQLINSKYKPLERIRPIEYSRQWSGLSEIAETDEHLGSFQITLNKKNKGNFSYQFDKMYRLTNYQGYKNSLTMNYLHKKWSLQGLTYNTKTLQSNYNTDYLFGNFTLARNFKWFSAGISQLSEKNQNLDSAKNLIQNSFYFNETTFFLRTADTNNFKLKAEYKNRIDFKSDTLSFKKETIANEILAELIWTPTINQRLSLLTTYRNLEISDSNLTTRKPENTTQTRIEYRTNAWKGLVRFNSYYESSSGLEVKRDYSYIQVSSGQGVYSWSDYNQNGIKELDEFEVAVFQDQANYIRILLPSNQYIKTYGSKFSATLNLSPSAKWIKSDIKALKILSRFSNNFAFNSQLKTLSKKFIINSNPIFYDLEDTNHVYINSFFRNSFYFNRNNPKFGAEYHYSKNINKILMVNGYEGRVLQKNELKIRWNLSRAIMTEGNQNSGQKIAYSEFFTTRNFNIKYQKTEGKLSFQPNQKYRIAILYAYGEKLNKSVLKELAISNEMNISAKISSANKGNVTATVGLIDLKYNAQQSDALAFEMLEGFKIGTNYKWGINYNRNLMNNLQLTFLYEGRLPYQSKTMHTGSVQLRAYF